MSVRQNMKQTLKQADTHIERLARAGYVAKGLVYTVIGILALQSALGIGWQEVNSKGAFREILSQPFGGIMLGLVVIGLLAYAFWLLLQATLDTEDEGSGLTGFVTRVGYGLNGFMQIGLAIIGIKLIVGLYSGSNSSPEDWTAVVLAQPLGWWATIGVGGGILATGLYQLYQAYQAYFQHDLKQSELTDHSKQWIMQIGRLGRISQALILGIVGAFVIQAALYFDPDQAKGLADALRTLEQQPFGPWMLGAVAIGLIAHGTYMFIEARYRRIELTD